MKKREFFKKAGLGAAAVASAPYIIGAKKAITWRLQTYAGPALAEHVIKPAVDAFNEAANGEMFIELYYADQLVPTGELFRAMQRGTIDAVQSDDDSIASPADVSVFGGYFPFATRYSLDVPTLFYKFGLDKIWEESYSEIKGVTWLGAGAWDPCNFATKDPIRSLDDFKGKKVFTFPTAGRFLSRFGVVPVTLPWEDIEMAVRTGELDGIAWSGITEDYTVGWADVTNYFLTNNISGAWIGSFFANSKAWENVPPHLQKLYKLCMDSSNYYRLHWYWGGEAQLRVDGTKMKLTTIPDEDWMKVQKEAEKFWDEIAATGPRAAKVIEIFRNYNNMMEKAGPPYRYS
ncbi:MAG: TRAP transporter substrate-binding protein [Puniceicoccales bacterium]